MLVLTRKNQESVVVGSGSGTEPMLTVTVLEIKAGKVKLGFKGDSSVIVHRHEVWERTRSTAAPTCATSSATIG
jgi:carbon storage regulator CsrA